MRKRFRFLLISLKMLWAKVTGKPFRAFLKSMLVRSYALVILTLVLAAGYFSVHYLFRTVFFPPPLPAPMMDWAARLDVSALRSEQIEGVERTAPRAPISHYHSVDQEKYCGDRKWQGIGLCSQRQSKSSGTSGLAGV